MQVIVMKKQTFFYMSKIKHTMQNNNGFNLQKVQNEKPIIFEQAWSQYSEKNTILEEPTILQLNSNCVFMILNIQNLKRCNFFFTELQELQVSSPLLLFITFRSFNVFCIPLFMCKNGVLFRLGQKFYQIKSCCLKNDCICC